jgi:MYXO-CTERM domain-containing protein
MHANSGANGRGASGVTYGGSGQSTAYLDPSFSVALSGPDANLYSLYFSTGVGNSPLNSVPDDGSTGAMVELAALFGFALRRRKRIAGY